MRVLALSKELGWLYSHLFDQRFWNREGTMEIRPFQLGDEKAIVALWERCGLTRPWNNPYEDIRRKRDVQSEWFLVGVVGETIVGSVMAGYDGHRGSVYYLGVDPQHQRTGLGLALMTEVERLLQEAGCPKINLMVRSDNEAIVAFYEQLGYNIEPIVCMGKRLIHDEG